MKPNKGFVRQLRVYEERLKRRRLSSAGGAEGIAASAASSAGASSRPIAAIGPQRPPATRTIGPQLPPQQRGAKRPALVSGLSAEPALDPKPNRAPGAASGAAAATATAVAASPQRPQATRAIGPQLPPQKRAKRDATTT